MIEPEEEQQETDRLGDLTDKIGDTIIVQESTRKDIAKTASLVRDSLKGDISRKPRRATKKKVSTQPKEKGIARFLPYGDEKSIRRTIATAIIAISGIAVISIIVSFILLATTTLLDQFGFVGGVIAIFIGISVPVGVASFFVATANKHDEEDYVKGAMR